MSSSEVCLNVSIANVVSHETLQLIRVMQAGFKPTLSLDREDKSHGLPFAGDTSRYGLKKNVRRLSL